MEERTAEQKKLEELANLYCPVCGYYCLGKGGFGCIDKLAMYNAAQRIQAEGAKG